METLKARPNKVCTKKISKHEIVRIHKANMTPLVRLIPVKGSIEYSSATLDHGYITGWHPDPEGIQVRMVIPWTDKKIIKGKNCTIHINPDIEADGQNPSGEIKARINKISRNQGTQEIYLSCTLLKDTLAEHDDEKLRNYFQRTSLPKNAAPPSREIHPNWLAVTCALSLAGFLANSLASEENDKETCHRLAGGLSLNEGNYFFNKPAVPVQEQIDSCRQRFSIIVPIEEAEKSLTTKENSQK
jgi:hypothetical protein